MQTQKRHRIKWFYKLDYEITIFYLYLESLVFPFYRRQFNEPQNLRADSKIKSFFANPTLQKSHSRKHKNQLLSLFRRINL
ncbi:TPA: hypothetical protein DGH83_04970 [Candidatus Peregrinibacteria bacterium]|nr:hypothetical protein [Candidatus Peregrinibacteria bacterium]